MFRKHHRMFLAPKAQPKPIFYDESKRHKQYNFHHEFNCYVTHWWHGEWRGCWHGDDMDDNDDMLIDVYDDMAADMAIDIARDMASDVAGDVNNTAHE